MTFGLRWLRGYASAVAVPAPAPFFLASNGWWNNIAECRAAYYNGHTYFAFIDDSDDIYAASYDHAAKTVTTPFLIGSGFSSPNGAVHNSVEILVRSSDHRLVVVMCSEGGANPYVRISTNPEDATAWGSATAILSGGPFIYGQLMEQASGDLFLFLGNFAGGQEHLGVASSSDGGATWSSVTNIVTPRTDSGNPDKTFYWRIGTDGTKCHIFATDTSRVDAHPSSVYHFYLEGGVLYQSDGTALGTSFPYSVTAGTLVQDASAGATWSEGIAIDGSGNPCTVLLTYDIADSKDLVKSARWTGSAWDVNLVTDTVGLNGGVKTVGGAAIGKTDPDTIWVPRQVGSYFELFKCTTSDGGSTWTLAQETSGSTDNVAAMDTPTDAAAGMQLIFGRGTYASDSSFAFDVWGYGT